MTSCHDVTKPDLSISACRWARKLILFLFPWVFKSMSSKLILNFHLCDAVTSWRHVMTSLNLIYLSQLVDMLESWFFFCFHGFLVHWVQKCYQFSIYVMPWRHDVMSWRHYEPDSYISASRCARKMIFFLISMVFWVIEIGYVNIFPFVWCRDVMTSCHDVTKPDIPISTCRWARKLILFLFSWFFRSLSSKMILIFHLCDAVTSWRHVMTSL